MTGNLSAPRKANHFVREWRKAKPLTQEKLAEMIGSTSGAISQLENGIINYTQPTLEAIATALGCRPGDLLNRPPERASGTPEKQLRSAMLAYGVHKDYLDQAMRAIIGFVEDDADDEKLPPDRSPVQIEPASSRREPEPTK